MSNFIKRFKEDLQLAGYAKRSIQSYASAVLRLQHFYNKPLHNITEEQLRQYWLCYKNGFGWSTAKLRISYSNLMLYSMGLRLREATALQVKDAMKKAGLPSPIIASKALKMVSLNFFTKTVKRKIC